MRKKEERTKENVAEGFDFDKDRINAEIDAEEKEKPSADYPADSKSPDQALQPDGTEYAKYYKPHPKTGPKGGRIGRPILDKKARKVQMNLTVTPEDKELYKKAAAKDNRNLPGFINAAVHEYIETHNLY